MPDYQNKNHKASDFLQVRNRLAYITGVEKIRGGRVWVQVYFPWTDSENQEFLLYHGYDRKDSDKGFYEFIRESEINLV